MDKASFAKLTVLVAVDGSPSSKDAVRHAAEIARGGDHVTLLHIVPFSSPPDYRDHAATVLQTVESFFRKHCQQVRVHFFSLTAVQVETTSAYVTSSKKS